MKQDALAAALLALCGCVGLLPLERPHSVYYQGRERLGELEYGRRYIVIRHEKAQVIVVAEEARHQELPVPVLAKFDVQDGAGILAYERADGFVLHIFAIKGTQPLSPAPVTNVVSVQQINTPPWYAKAE